MGFKGIVCAALVLAAAAAPAMAGEGKISGDVFGDMYWFAANHDSAYEDQSGMWFRRINLSYDYKMSDTYSARVRFEALSPDFTQTSANMVPYMKDAWVKWASGTHGIMLGLQQTPLSNLVETVWGYRSIERGPGDLHGFGGSRDIGFGAQGTFDANKRFGYHLLFGNGGGTKSEDSTKKKAMLALSVKPTDALVLEVYGDYEDRVNDGDRKTMQVFLGYMADRFRAGVQYTQQNRAVTGEDLELPIISGFLAGNVSEKMWLFGRVDHITEPNPQGDKIAYVPMVNNATYTYVVGGLDWTLHEEKNDKGKLVADVHLMPNVETVFYDKPAGGGEAPDTDVIPRTTFQFRF